jgi:hypothetical protein
LPLRAISSWSISPSSLPSVSLMRVPMRSSASYGPAPCFDTDTLYPASRGPAGQRRRPSARIIASARIIEGAVLLRVVCPSCLQASFSTSKALPIVGHVANCSIGSTMVATPMPGRLTGRMLAGCSPTRTASASASSAGTGAITPGASPTRPRPSQSCRRAHSSSTAHTWCST